MTFATRVLPSGDYPRRAADLIADALPTAGTVVLTGGTTAEKIYPFLALHRPDWSGLSVAFSDERCVPPDDPASNYKMANDLLLRDAAPSDVYRMPGEADPSEGALSYGDAIAARVADGWDLLLMGMGADAHIGALYPGSPALDERELLCAAVARPDGMTGLTLTPPAMLAAKKILLLVTGDAKATTVRRALEGAEDAGSCPVLLLADHPNVTFVLDEAAAP